MTSRWLARHWVLLLTLYLGVDFMDPSIPGVFFFETEALFMDGVVEAKSTTACDLAVAEPAAGVDWAEAVDTAAPAQRCADAPRLVLPHWRGRPLKHDDSPSFASPSSPDSAAPAL